MNLLAGKVAAVMYLIITEHGNQKITKQSNSFLLLILKELDFKLIEEISNDSDFFITLKRWGSEVKELVNKGDDEINTEDFLALIRNCNLSQDALEKITLLLTYNINDDSLKELIFNELNVDSPAMYHNLNKAFKSNKDDVEILTEDIGELIYTTYFLLDKVRESVVVQQAVTGVKTIEEYDLISDIYLRNIIREDDINEYFPEVNSKVKAYQGTVENGGLVFLEILRILESKLSQVKKEQLMGSLVRICYGNRPPSESTRFDYLLIEIMALSLGLKKYFVSFKNNFIKLSKGYIITPKLSYKDFYLHTDKTKEKALNDLLLEVSKNKYDLSFFNPEKMDFKSNYIPSLYVDCDINIDWVCLVESHRTQGESKKLGSVEIPSENIHFEAVEETATIHIDKIISLEEGETKNAINLNRQVIIESSKKEKQDGFEELNKFFTAEQKLKALGKQTELFKDDIVGDLGKKYPGKKYKPDTLSLQWNGFEEKKSFYATIYVPVLNFQFKNNMLSYFPLNLENKVQFSQGSLQPLMSDKIEKYKSLRNLIFIIIGIWFISGMYKLFFGDASFGTWGFTLWWWIKVVFFITLFILSVVGFENYKEDEEGRLEQNSLERILSKEYKGIDKKRIQARIKKLSKKGRQFSIFTKLDLFLERLNKK